LGDRPVAYHPKLAPVLGGVKETIFVCQFLYWNDKGKLPGGWIWKKQAEITEETGLSRYEQETVRRNLKKRGILEEDLRGIPATLHYRLDLDKLTEAIYAAYLPADKIAETPQTEPRESRKQAGDNPANKTAETPQSIPESTAETTPESTAEKALPDPLAVLAEKGWVQQGDSWTVPAAAGGADDWQPCVDAFAGLVGVNPDILPRSDRKEWSRVLSEIGVKWGVGPPTVQKAIESVPESQFDWKTYATPHQAEADLSTLVGQIRSGGVKKPKQKGAADDFEAIMAAFAGTEGTMIIDGDCVVL